MTLSTRILAEGAGWTVTDFRCEAGPYDPSFEEMHERSSIALVLEGAFRYETSQGAADLVAGSVLLGNRGHCFQCGHDHSWGDRCISFHFAPEMIEQVASEMPGARTTEFARVALPPLGTFIPLTAHAGTLDAHSENGAFEDLSYRVVETVFATLAEHTMPAVSVNDRDRRRVADAVRRIERKSDSALTLSGLAREAGVSAFHFLRIFRDSVGMTPHQFLLRTRLQNAALELRQTVKPISTIAFDAGFGDLSTFNRRFKRLMGVSPSDWRLGRTAAA
ncbi:MAG TPA: helix-turn-helix transcriptional regulator [Rhizomicrobium sp.]|nr:helix-turn-helix transcriptional regulator [Rhizomicrobium sp.]